MRCECGATLSDTSANGRCEVCLYADGDPDTIERVLAEIEAECATTELSGEGLRNLFYEQDFK